MSLGSALQIAQNSLLNVTRQTNVVSRNITDAGKEDYSHRNGVLESSDLGSRVVVLRNGVDGHLNQTRLAAISDASAQNLVSEHLSQLNVALNGVDGSRSPSAGLVRLHDSLQLFSAEPSNNLLANAAVQDAKDLANTLNGAYGSILTMKAGLDGAIEGEVNKLNQLLSQFQSANTEVVNASVRGLHALDALDQRDALLKQISEIVPVTTVGRDNHDMMLITSDGASLFETVPREVSFQPNATYTAGTIGSQVRIDGVPVIAGSGANSSAGGSLSALLQLRDQSLGAAQNQLDEVARGLVSAFAETDAAGGGSPALTGLFTWSGAPAIPAGGALSPGLAAEIEVDARYDPAQGGDSFLLRDGGANGVAYIHNTSGAASFSDRLISLATGLDEERTFDVQSGIGGDKSLLKFAAQSIGWLDGERSTASRSAITKDALVVRLSEKISNQTGVNIDEEMATLLQLEQSYEASARLISVVDEMLTTLMNVTR